MTLLGSVEPRVCTWRETGETAGGEVAALSRAAGQTLLPWQERVLHRAMQEDWSSGEGRLASRRVGLVVPRRNGKSALVEAVMLHRATQFQAQRIVYSAHLQSTADELFERFVDLASRLGAVDRDRDVRYANGQQRVSFPKTGSRVTFRTRTSGGGRGLAGDLIFLDEAYALRSDHLSALLPVLATRVDYQVWYVSSAELLQSEEQRKVREQGEAGTEGLAYFEWSAAPPDGDLDLDDRSLWASANPSLGTLIPEQAVYDQRMGLPDVDFAREWLGVRLEDLPATGQTVVDLGVWDLLGDADETAGVRDPRFAVDVTPDASRASIGVAGWRADGLPLVEVVENLPGTAWVPERLVEALDRGGHRAPVLVDPTSRAAALIPDLLRAGVEVSAVKTADVTAATSGFLAAAKGSALRHFPSMALLAALAGARTRPVGREGAVAWDRKDQTVDLSPLVAVSFALQALRASAAPAGPVDLQTAVW